jgi:hypothetical protein
MSLLNRIRNRAPRRIAAWSAEVAQNAMLDTAARLSPAIHRMTMSEARGYIRARGAAALHEHLKALQDEANLSSEIVLAVRDKALSQLVRLTLGDVLSRTRPAPALRRAA